MAGISIMIGRKLFIIKHNTNQSYAHDFAIEVPDLEEVKDVTNSNFKKYSYKTLVVMVRFYVLTLDFLKVKYKILEEKIKRIKLRKNQKNIPEIKEANKVLSMISEYKKKIKNIRKRIKEEEGI